MAALKAGISGPQARAQMAVKSHLRRCERLAGGSYLVPVGT
jgi:hypothetical protein